MSDKLKKLEVQKAKIAAEIQRIKGRETAQARKDDTRRKIIVGGLVLGMVERGEVVDKNGLLAALSKSLTRPQDRALFHLSTACPETPNRG
ncbi:MAG: hypothetical protein ACYCZ9_10170 [Thermoleophilia bacterium]